MGTDPCAGVPSATLVQCMRTGVTAAQYGNGTTPTITQCVSGQCGQVIEGNDELKPEVAKTWSVGLSFTPVELPDSPPVWITTTSNSKTRLGIIRSPPS